MNPEPSTLIQETFSDSRPFAKERGDSAESIISRFFLGVFGLGFRVGIATAGYKPYDIVCHRFLHRRATSSDAFGKKRTFLILGTSQDPGSCWMHEPGSDGSPSTV